MKSLSNFARFSIGQVSAISCHPLNKDKFYRVWLNFFRDQLSARLSGGRPQICHFLGSTKLALTTFTAPGIHYSRVSCMHDYEEMSFFFDALAPGDVFLDVGANAGSFGVIAIARGCKQVIAFEPSPKTNWITRLNFEINGAKPGRHLVLSRAVGKVPGVALITANLGGTDHLLPGKSMPDSSSVEVDVVTLDSMDIAGMISAGHFLGLKVDVEGRDLDVLAGARCTLQEVPMALVCVEGNANQGEIRDFMKALGFDQVRYEAFAKKLIRSESFTPNHNGLFVKGFSQLLTRFVAVDSVLA